MAGIPTLVQSPVANTTTLAPATLTTTFASTGIGNCLIALIAGAMSASGSVSLPAGWVQVYQQSQAAILAAAFVYPNNPGGITTVAATLTNFNGCVCQGYEFTGINATQPVDGAGPFVQVKNTASTVLGGAATTATPTIGNEVWLGMLAFLVGGGALTLANLPTSGNGIWTAGTLTSSTTGATNISAQGFYAQPGPTYPQSGAQMKISASIAVAQSNFAAMFSLFALVSAALGASPDNGTYGGYAANAAYGGAVGG